VYELLLRKETFFNWNRSYLLITSITSLLLPFIKLKSFSKVIPSEIFVNLPAVILGEEKEVSPAIIESLNTVTENTTSITFLVFWIWYFGILVFSCVLFFKLYKVWRFKRSSNSIQKKAYSIVTLKNSEDAFSFWNHIFLGDQIENTQKESILKHEKVHVDEKHTIDLLWFELLRIAFWFNPLVYIYQKRITEVHEFIADKSASKQQQNYYENLLAKTFNIAQFSLVNQFYSSSLIKKRIIMLTKEKSRTILKLKYLIVAPIIIGMLMFSSSGYSQEIIVEKETSASENIKGEIPFSVIDQVPIYPGCDESATLEELKKCFSLEIAKHINKNFNTKIGKIHNLLGRQKIYIAFKVDEQGQLKDIKARGPHEALVTEAERVINTLPTLKPGMHNGKAVTVPFSIPVIFQIN